MFATPPMPINYGKTGTQWTDYEIWIFDNWPKNKAMSEICGINKRSPKAFSDRMYQERVKSGIVGQKLTKEQLLERGKISGQINIINSEIENYQRKYNSMLVAAKHYLKKIVELQESVVKLNSELGEIGKATKKLWK